MGIPVIIVPSRGLPVTVSASGYGLPMTVSTSGYGLAVTQATGGGGLAVTGISFGPTIALVGTSVLETAAVNTVVGTLSVTAGTTGTPVFALVDSAGGKFNISGTSLRTNALLDYETATSHSITVSVSGVTPTVANATFTISVTDVAEPVIQLTGTTINENSAAGTNIGVLSIVNSYTGTPAYTLVDSSSGKVAISGSNLNVLGAIDYETTPTFNITVSVSGITPAAANKVFTVVVLDVAETAVARTITWDPTFIVSGTSGNPTYSTDKLTATGSGAGAWNSAWATYGANIEKLYCEFKFTVTFDGVPGWAMVGLSNLESLGSNLGVDVPSIAFTGDGNVQRNNTNIPLAAVSWALNDWIAMAVDFGAGKCWIKNITTGGTWNGVSGDPVAGTGSYAIPATGKSLFPGCTLGYNGNMVCTVNFGATAYAGTPPTGYLKWGEVPRSMTWDFTDPGSGAATYSNFNLTATGVNVAGTWNTVMGSVGRRLQRLGKYYWECRLDAATTLSKVIFGLNATNYFGNTQLGFGGTNIGWVAGTGSVNAGSIDIKLAVVTVAVGDWVALAIDINNAKFYVKNITAGGTWNGVGGDPAAGTGYIGISPVTSATDPVAPTVQLGQGEAGSAVTANFGASTYQATPPIGFVNWGGDTAASGGGTVTKNIVTDYGAVGDAQWAQTTLSISTNVLTSATPIWVSGDIGKSIVIPPAPFGSPHLSTITAVGGGGTTATLSSSTSSPLSGYDAIVAWGTDSTAAFQAFKTAYQGQTVTLTIPAGKYLISSGNFLGMWDGIHNITVNATGATLCGGTFTISASAQYEAPGHTARTASVTAGSTYVTLTTPSEVSRFVIGDYAMMTGFDMQHSGYPINQSLWEYLQIVAIDSTVGSPTYGRITFATPLVNSYLSTWPVYNASGTDYGGPATLYAMDPKFNHTSVINGLTVAHHGQWGTGGLNQTFNNCVFEGIAGPYPSLGKSITYNNCTGLNATMEIDKLATSFTMTGCTWYALYMQSVAIDLMTLDNTDIIGTMTGSARKLVIRNGCNINALHPSPAFFGYSHELNVSDSVISTLGSGAGSYIKGGTGANNGIHIDYTMSGGVITVPAAMRTTGAGQWAISNEKMFFVDTVVGTLGAFTITNVADGPGGSILVTTNWSKAGGGFPPRTYNPSQGLFLQRNPAIICTFTNVTGCAEVVDLCNAGAAGLPLNSYSKRTYTGSSDSGHYFQVWGRFKKIVVTVTTAYTGSVGTVTATLGFSNNQGIKASDGTNTTVWAPVINLKTTGVRTFDATAGSYPVAWTGGVAGDTLTSQTEALWCGGNGIVSITDVSSSPGSPPMVFTVEIITDQT